MKSDASLSSPDWALPVRRFGLLLSIACLSLSGCRAVAPEENDDESSSEEGSAEGSEEQDPEESEEDNDDEESEEPEDSEEDDEEDDEDDEDDEDSENSGGGGGGDIGERDCEKIEWGEKGVKKGEIVARGDVQGFADSDGDFEPEKKEVDAGMCELHLTKYRCALVLYGAG